MSKPEFVTARVFPGDTNALVKNIMKQLGETDPNEAVRLVNAGLVKFERITPKWTEEDGVMRFQVTTNGRTGPEWESWCDKKGHKLNKWSRELLNHPDFVARPAGQTIEVTVLKGELFKGLGRSTKNIRAEAEKRKLKKADAELACLIREKFSNAELEEMGLFAIIAMHEPIEASDGGLALLGVRRNDSGSWLRAYYDYPDGLWDRDSGFAFVGSQVSTHS